MTRVLVGLLTILGLIIGTIAMRPADAQDNTEPRLSALETQVADLTARVEALEGGWSAFPSTPTAVSEETHRLLGSITIISNFEFARSTGDYCQGKGGYNDLIPGAPVVVKDEAGNVIARGELGSSTVVDYLGLLEPGRGKDCKLAFLVMDVPDAKFYSIEVSHRGGLTYSREDLESLDWTLELTIGG